MKAEKLTRLDLFEIANIANLPPREVFPAFDEVAKARRASSRLFAADVRHANELTPTASAERAAERACAELSQALPEGITAAVVAPGGGFRYIEIATACGAHYGLI